MAIRFFNSLFFLFLLFASNAALADNPPANPPANPPGPTAEEIAALREENERLKKQIEKGSKSDDEEDLNDKVKASKEAKEAKERESKELQDALRFNLTSDKFIEEHKSILPKDMADIFSAAEKEKYDSEIDKANAIKSALIQSFFNLQANVDLLTPSHKVAVEDYFKLTKKGKEEKAQEMYRNIFEPTLGMIKQIKKAEELGKAKGGLANETETDAAYRQKLMAGSKRHFLGEK